MNDSPALLRILLLEDSDHDAIAFQRALDKSPLNCRITRHTRAEDVPAPYGKLAEEHDILVADYKLPGSTGLDLCRRVIGAQVAIPCVLLTGAGSEDIAVTALQAGLQDYLTKDFNQSYLEVLPLFLSNTIQKYQHQIQAEILEQERRLLITLSQLYLKEPNEKKLVPRRFMWI